jgi:hypothetical protein
MKKATYRTWGLAGLAVLAGAFALIAWTGNPQQQQPAPQQTEDTVPTDKRNKTTRDQQERDFDKELQAIEKAQQQLREQDWDRIERQVEEALNNIQTGVIEQQIANALKQVEQAKIQQQVQEALAKVNFEKISKEIENAVQSLTKVDQEKLQAELKRAEQEMQRALSNQDWEKEIRVNIEKEMEKAKASMQRAKEQLKKEKIDFKKEMEKANSEIKKAQAEMKGYQEMVYAMEKEGLLSTDEDYTITYSKGELAINGKKQPASVANKYRKYFSRDHTTITKKEGNINISNK